MSTVRTGSTRRIPFLSRSKNGWSAASSDWIGRLLDIAKTTKFAGELAPFPYVKIGAGILVELLEIVQVVLSLAV
jgi:hypothetical protein